MDEKNGFTLVELIGVILLLGLMSLIIVPSLEKSLKGGISKADRQTEENIITSAKNWGMDNKKSLPKDDGLSISVSLSTLQDGGYVDKNLVWPSSKEEISNLCIVIRNNKGIYDYKIDRGCEVKYSSLTFDYETNGGTSTTAKNMESVESGTKINLGKYAAFKSGYEFVGWNTNKDAHSGLDSYSMPNKNTTLYAIYKKAGKKFMAKFSGNGGSGSVSSKSCTTSTVYNLEALKSSCDITLPSNGFKYSGYDFIGWSTDSNASSGLSANTTVSLSGDATYYAIWDEDAPSCYITVDGDTKYYNGYYWHVTEEPTITLNTSSNTSRYVFNDNITVVSTSDKKTFTLTKDVTDGLFSATVYNASGKSSTCSLRVSKYSTPPKIYLALYNAFRVNGNNDGYYELYSASNSDLEIPGRQFSKFVGFRIVAVDFYDPDANLPKGAIQTGGYGSGYATAYMIDENGERNLLNCSRSSCVSKFCKDDIYDYENMPNSNRLNYFETISFNVSKYIQFEASDKLGNTRTVTLYVNVS